MKALGYDGCFVCKGPAAISNYTAGLEEGILRVLRGVPSYDRTV